MLEVGVILGDQVMEWQSGKVAVVKKIVIKIYHIVAKWQWQKKVCEKKYISDRVAKWQ